MRICSFFDIIADVMVKRLLERGKTSGRADDNLECIRRRLEAFREETIPVIDEYRKLGKVRRVDASMGGGGRSV